MIYFKYNVDIMPNTKGVAFRKNIFEKILEPGLHEFYFVNLNEYRFVILDSEPRSVLINNQEILSKDQIAFRLSFAVEYVITDFEKATKSLDFFTSQGHTPLYWMSDLDALVHQEVQIEMNSKLSQIESETIFSDYKMLDATEEERVNVNKNLFGIEVKRIRIKEVNFPKIIQELFSKKLDAKIRTQTELENARTTVAAARALNNATSMINENPGVKYLLYLDTLKFLATKGKHTFIVGGDESLKSEK